MRLVRWFLCAGTMAAMLAASAPAPAEDEIRDTAREAFRAAKQAFDEGEYRAAALLFENASRLAPDSNASFNAAKAWERVPGERAREADALSRALTNAALPPVQREEASARLTSIERDVAVVDVTGPASSKIAIGTLTGLSPPASVHVEPGKTSVRVTFVNGQSATRDVEAVAGKHHAVSIQEPAPERSPVLSILGWTSAGLATTLGASAIGLGLATVSARDEFELGGRTDADLRDRAVGLRLGTNVAWFSAGAFAVAGTVMLIYDATQRGGAGASISVGLDRARLEVVW